MVEEEEGYSDEEIEEKRENLEKDRLELAFEKAKNLDESEEQGFVLYKPKFVVDSEFSLERE